MRKMILIIISALALIGSPALAKEAGANAWIVSQLSGDARVVHPGLRPAALKVQARLAPGDTVLTGVTGRATLTRGADYIIVAPLSELRLPAAPEPTGFTRVIQNLGTMFFKVRHTGVPHFAVDTPMLAAVVKGTTFTVIVDRNRSAVQVIEGAVQVSATDGGMSRLVEGGKTVYIDRGAPKLLIDADERSPGATTSSTTAAVRLNGSQAPSVTAIANLTGGLVHAGTPAITPATGPATPAPALPTQPAMNVVDATAPGIADPVAGVVDTTTDTVTDVVDTTTDTVIDVVDTTTDVVDTTTDTVIDVVDATTDTVVDVVDTTTDVVDTVTDVVDTTVTEVTGTTTDVIGGVLNGLFPR
ncbi:MAG TPA: FecR family protein [Sphingomicrobium sp.]|nr:FecR family protein [Sphingomicrobium sp.]